MQKRAEGRKGGFVKREGFRMLRDRTGNRERRENGRRSRSVYLGDVRVTSSVQWITGMWSSKQRSVGSSYDVREPIELSTTESR
jgi:hypothetical protein